MGLRNMVASVGSFVLAFGILIFIVNYIKSARSGEKASGDPWDVGRWSGLFRRRHRTTTSCRFRRSTTGTHGGLRSGSASRRCPSRAVPRTSTTGTISSASAVVLAAGEVVRPVHRGVRSAVYHRHRGHIECPIVGIIGGAITLIGIAAWALEPINEPDESPEHH